MGKRINTDELEDYLKDVADGHRMYPSNQIWTNIRENLHGTPRWPALTFISLFVITSLIIGTVFIKPDENIMRQIASKPLSATKQEIPKNTFAETINPEKVTSRTIDKVINNRLAVVNVPEEEATVSQPLVEEIVKKDRNQNILTADFSIRQLPVYMPSLVIKNELNADIIFTEKNAEAVGIENIEADKVENKQTSLSVQSTIVLPKAKTSRWEVGFYITPSSSFRKMSDDNKLKAYSAYNIIPSSSNNVTDVNEVIRHKPSMGIETGVAFSYKLTGQLKLKAGLQLNIRQYDIEAYSSYTEMVQLTLLNGRQVDTVNAPSNYRNGNGSFEITLKNKYHEISVPLGIEWSNNITDRLSWGIAATVQPTYTFGKKAYVISNDYKNYTSDAPVFKNWNVNTGVEAYISYKAGKYTWHLGPQVRYQQLSSYSNKYPIKENLYDYGVKFGFTKTIR